MKKQDQVTNVELSNKIHELGITTPSLYYRDSTTSKENEIKSWHEEDGDYCPDNINCYTPAEIVDLIPVDVHGFSYFTVKEKWIDIVPSSKYHDVFFAYEGVYGKNMANGEATVRSILAGHFNTEANAGANILIYLIENKLIDVK